MRVRVLGVPYSRRCLRACVSRLKTVKSFKSSTHTFTPNFQTRPTHACRPHAALGRHAQYTRAAPKRFPLVLGVEGAEDVCTQHTRTPLHPAALASVPYGIVLVRVRMCAPKAGFPPRTTTTTAAAAAATTTKALSSNYCEGAHRGTRHLQAAEPRRRGGWDGGCAGCSSSSASGGNPRSACP